MKTIFVTAYYDIPNKFGGKTKYREWIYNFLGFVKDIQMVCFSTGNALEWLKKTFINQTIIFIDLPIEEFYTFQYKFILEQQLNIDPEKHIHSVELYIIWNEKAFFVQRAIQHLRENCCYSWIDIGMIRDSRLSSLMSHFPEPSGIHILSSINKMCVLGIVPQNLSHFSNCDSNGISNINKSQHEIISIGGGCIFGNKEHFLRYIQRYKDLFELYIKNNLFVGKDQNLMANLVINYPDEIAVIDSQQINVWSNLYQKDIWFNMINILLGTESNKATHTPELMGGLGNQLFQVAAVFGFSKTKKELCVLDSRVVQPNAHSKINYLETIFSRFLTYSAEYYTHRYFEKQIHRFDSYDDVLSQHTLYTGYFQHYKYIEPYLEEFKKLLVLPETEPTESFFIHFRCGDYINHPDHYVDLSRYYQRCLERLDITHPNVVYSVFSNDIELARKFFKETNKANRKFVFVEETNELISLSKMVNCKLGGICANSTFSWWAGVLNSNPDKLVFFPDQNYPITSQYRYADISGMFHPSFTIVKSTFV